MKKNKKNPSENEAETNVEDITAKEENSQEELPEKEEENSPQTEEIDIEELQAQNKKLKEDYLRAFAELENTKKRCAQEIDKNNKYAISSFAKSLLSVADNLGRAISAASDSSNSEQCDALLKGVELTQNELDKVFNKFGITKMNILNTVFDPNFHQVIQEVEDKEKPAGTIIAELQTGYMINGRLLREAMVVVTK